MGVKNVTNGRTNEQGVSRSRMPRAALPLSYMAGSILLYEVMTSVTILQLALEPFLSLISFGEKGAREISVCSEEIHSALQYSVV